MYRKIVFWLFLFLLPTQLGKHFFMDFSYVNGVRVDYLAPAIYLTDCLFLVLLAFFWRPVYKNFIKNRRVWLIIGILTILNIAFIRYPLLGLYTVLKYLEIYILFVISRSARFKPKFILSALSAGAAIQLILTLLQLNAKSSIQGIFYFLGERFMTLSSPGIAKAGLLGQEILRPYGTFSHPNSLGGFYLLLYSYILTLKIKPHWKALALALPSMLIFISFSKLAIFTYVLINIGYFIFHAEKKCTICTISRFIVLLIVVLVFLQTQTDPLTLEKRLYLLRQSLTIIAQNPLLGTGFGHELFAHAQFTSQYSYFFLQPVHNIFILFVMQAGLLLSGVVGLQIWKYVRCHWQKLLLPIIVLLFTGSGDHYWLTLQQNMLLAGVIFGFLVLEKTQKNI